MSPLLNNSSEDLSASLLNLSLSQQQQQLHHHHQQQNIKPPSPLILSNSNTGNINNPNDTSLPTLKVMNLPLDITQREAVLIFSLCLHDLISIDLMLDPLSNSSQMILASFNSYKVASQILQLLDGKSLFGNGYPNIKCELINNIPSKSTINSPILTSHQFSKTNANGTANGNAANHYGTIHTSLTPHTPNEINIGNSSAIFNNPFNHPEITTPTTAKSSNASSIPDSTITNFALLPKVPPPANPADQNPPCNTLYVGNLPPDTSEFELRQLFQQQPGFKRLSFKSKQNSLNGSSSNNLHHGPMCFVEFEDIPLATKALNELYGTTLKSTVNNLLNKKGGIRLSFSKNPLGVRSPNQQRRNGPSSSNISSTITNYGNISAPVTPIASINPINSNLHLSQNHHNLINSPASTNNNINNLSINANLSMKSVSMTAPSTPTIASNNNNNNNNNNLASVHSISALNSHSNVSSVHNNNKATFQRANSFGNSSATTPTNSNSSLYLSNLNFNSTPNHFTGSNNNHNTLNQSGNIHNYDFINQQYPFN